MVNLKMFRALPAVVAWSALRWVGSSAEVRQVYRRMHRSLPEVVRVLALLHLPQ